MGVLLWGKRGTGTGRKGGDITGCFCGLCLLGFLFDALTIRLFGGVDFVDVLLLMRDDCRKAYASCFFEIAQNQGFFLFSLGLIFATLGKGFGLVCCKLLI